MTGFPYPPPCPRHDSGVSPGSFDSLKYCFKGGAHAHHQNYSCLLVLTRAPSKTRKTCYFSSENRHRNESQQGPERAPKITTIVKSLSQEACRQRRRMESAKKRSPELSREALMCFRYNKYHASSTLHKVAPGSLSVQFCFPCELLWACC